MESDDPKNRKKVNRGSRHNPPTNAIPTGVTLNPHGAPRKGCSTAEAIRWADGLTADEAAAFLVSLGGDPTGEMIAKLKTLPPGVPLKSLSMLRARLASGVGEVTPGLLEFLANRTEGKVPDRVEGVLRLEICGLSDAVPGAGQ